MSIKVLVVGHHFVTKHNQRRLEELGKHDDLEITLLTPEWWYEESRKVYLEKKRADKYIIFKGKTLFTNHTALSFYVNKLFGLMLKIRPDIIDVYEEPWSLTTLQVLLIKRLFLRDSKVMFYSAQNINKKYPFFFRWVEQFTFRNADYAYPCSEGAAEVLRDKGYKGKLKVIPLGLDEKESVKRIRDDTFAIGYVGRLVKEKGILDLVDAVAIAGQVRGYKLLIVGEGPLKPYIIERAKQKGILEKIEFAGAVKREEMPSIYALMDVLVVPSKTTPAWKEQFGRIIAEAFLFGVPVIGSDSGSIPEVMAGCGFLFREGDVQDLADTIDRVRKDDNLRNLQIEKAKEYARNNYTWEKTAGEVYKIYKELYEKNISA